MVDFYENTDLIIEGDTAPEARAKINSLADLTQDHFTRLFSLATGFLTAPTVTLDTGNDKVDCTDLSAVLGGVWLNAAGSWQFTNQSNGTYYLQITPAGAYAAATSENAAYLTVATVVWTLSTTTLSSLTVLAQVGLAWVGGSADLSQWVPRGTWNSGVSYRGNVNLRDVVTYQGSCYVALSDHTSASGTAPGVGASWTTVWQLLASKGDTGAKGDAGGILNPRGDWLTGTAYALLDAVVGSDGHGYQCITAHTAGDEDDEPGVGVDYGTYWARFVNRGATGAAGADGAGWNQMGAWVTSTAYAITPDIDWVTHNGGSYACILAHTSGASSEPGVGASWETYWVRMAEKGSPGDPMNWTGAWITSTAYSTGDGVNRLGSSYYCKQAHTSGTSSEPGVGASWTTYWDYIALKGDAGTATGYNARGAWSVAASYAVTPNYDVVTNNGSTYRCKLAHTAGLTDEPGVGANWATYWELMAQRGGGLNWRGAWATSTYYGLFDSAENDGSSYICVQAHTSGAASEPGTGGSWTDYWELVASVGSPGAPGPSDASGINVSGEPGNYTPTAGTVQGHLEGIDAALAGVAPDGDSLAAVSANDTTPGYLNGKLVQGTGITLTENNNGGNETLTIASTITQYTDAAAVDAVEAAATVTDAPDGSSDYVLVVVGGVLKKITPNNYAKRLETIVLGAGGKPQTTSGCADLAWFEMATNKQMVPYFAFDASTSEYLQYLVRMPDNYDGGTVKARFVWMHDTATTNFVVRWGIQAFAYGDNLAWDQTWGTGVEVSDTGGTAKQRYETAESGAITIGGTPAAGKDVLFRIYRNPGHTDDTLAVDALLVGVVLEYGINAHSA